MYKIEYNIIQCEEIVNKKAALQKPIMKKNCAYKSL